MSLDTKALIEKLSSDCRRSLEKAAQACVAQTHFNVELEHLLLQLLDHERGEVRSILRAYDIADGKVAAELNQAIEGFKRGNSRTPALAQQIVEAMEAAWLITSLQLRGSLVRPGAMLLAVIESDSLRRLVVSSCPTLLKLSRERLKEDLPALLKATDAAAADGRADKAGEGPARPAAAAAGGALGQYTIDLTLQAAAGKVDPILGRDAEIRQLVDILMRRRQNNPILTGEAGVGKTAVVEGLAQRIAAKDVPQPLKDVSIRILDLGLLQAGAGIKGEFENRLKSVIAEVAASPKPIILFIDEAHAMIGAGGQAGQSDAANLLKPALARGELRTIAATTWSEYKKYFEKDPALARRFQVVKVAEPDAANCEIMLRGLLPKLEAHHKVRVLNEAVVAAVRLSQRYISGRQLPDKAVSVLDTAAARVAVAQNATPGMLEGVQRRINRLDEEMAVLTRERSLGGGHDERIAHLEEERRQAEAKRLELEARWRREQALVAEIQSLSAKLENGAGAAGAEAGPAEGLARLSALKAELAACQGGDPMVPAGVDAHVVAAVVSAWTGVPVGKMMSDDIDAMLSLENRMGERLIGQDQALQAIARRIRTFHADMGEPGKPVGIFLLVGPSGVGKTETAVTLADLLFGGERNMIAINMSEYQEPHSVASLKGSPPGYVGYGTGGVLTEAVRRNPYSVLLLDEAEKAHPDVMDLFYQVFDKGVLEDGEGTEVNFRNTLILLTSNLGSDRIVDMCGGGRRPSAEDMGQAVYGALVRRFKPALLARMVVVPYYPLDDDMLARIIQLKLARIRERLFERHRAQLEFAEGIGETILKRCAEVESGARQVDRILTNTLLPELSERILERIGQGLAFKRIIVDVGPAGAFAYQFDDGGEDAA
jgi:type VI secretion system protein VasG